MMMALRDLLAAIEAEAATDIERLRAERHREAAAILADAELQATELERSAVCSAEHEEREAGERRLAAARQAIAGRQCDAHEAAYQQIAGEVRACLRTVRERGDYPAILAALLDEARSALPAGTLVRVDPADEGAGRRLIQGENGVRVAATLRCAGGLRRSGGERVQHRGGAVHGRRARAAGAGRRGARRGRRRRFPHWRRVPAGAGVTGYDYGNARLRARRAALLRREQYADLAGRDLPVLVAALSVTSYRRQAEATADGRGGTESLNRIARDHLAAALADISGLYRGRARDVVTSLLGPFDVHAMLTVLRARHHGTPAEVACALPVPVGGLSAETALQAARAPDLPAAARFLAARRLPDPDTAAALVSAQRRYEIDADLAGVEKAVARSARAHQVAVLAAAGAEAGPATAAVRRETDDLNLLIALRLREAAADGSGEADRDAFLPGGTVPLPLLAAIRRAPTRADSVAAAAPAHRAWHGLLAAWAEGGDLAALHSALETERLRTQLRALRGGDPLGAAPVLHYVLAHQAQARNLRLLAQAAAGAVSHDQARRQLVAPI